MTEFVNVLNTATPSDFDVIVVGATEAGCLAAVAAARLGRRVLLTSDNERFGWMTGYGINWQDVEPEKTHGVINGLAYEFLAGVAFRETPNKTLARHWRAGGWSRPSWWRRAWARFLAHPNITRLPNAKIASVQKTGTTIQSITFTDLGTFTADVFVEGTPCGDMVQRCLTSYSIGREDSALYGETLKAGIKATVAWPGSASIDPYVIPGNAGSGLIYGVDNSAAGTVGAADGKVMAFGYRLFLTSVAGDKIAFPAPDLDYYNASRYELLGRAFAAAPSYYGDATSGLGRIFQLYDVSPSVGTDMGPTYHNYVDLNSGGPFSTNYPVPDECLEYVTASYTRRAEIEYKAKQHVLGLIYWLLNSGDSRIPSVIKTALSAYGLSNKEMGEYGGMSPQFYQREGARAVGDFVMTAALATLTYNTTYPIGYLFYGFDSHYVRRLVSGGVVVTEGAMLNPQGTNYGSPIPLEILLPKVAECTNLVLASQPSVSQAYWCSLRAIPTMLQVGAAAGILAAVASQEYTTVQAVNKARVVQLNDHRRTADGTVLDVTGTFSDGAVTDTGTWNNGASSRFGGIGAGAGYATVAALTAATKKFSPNIYETGAYEVFIAYPPAQTTDPDGVSSQSRATNAKVTISSAAGSIDIRVDLRWPNGRGGRWESLGVYTFRQGLPSADYVQFDATDADGNLVISAVKWVPVSLRTLAGPAL